MRGVAIALCFALAGFVIPAAADDALQRELSQVLNQYFTAVNSGKVEEALSLRTKESGADLAKELGTGKNRAEQIEFWKALTPERFQVDHVEGAANGTQATLFVTATKTFPPAQAREMGRKSGRMEMFVVFHKEGGVWRVHDNTITGDPDQIKRSPDENFEPKEAFNTAARTDVAGRVVRARFEADYTVVIVRVLDEEIVALLPSRKVLEGYGFNFDTIAPWSNVLVQGHVHKTNSLKLFALGLKPR